MRNGRGEAGFGAQRRDHEGPRVEHGAGAKQAPLTLGGRRRSLSKEDADPPGPPASGAAEDQAANRRERGEDIVCRRCSDWDGGPRPTVPGRCPGIERGGHSNPSAPSQR